MADGIFGDESLFAEFDKERDDTQSIFIQYEQDESGIENRSRIVFMEAESDAEDSDEDIAEKDGQLNSESENKESDSKGDNQDTDLETEQKTESGDDASSEPQVQSSVSETEYQKKFEKNKFKSFARIIDSTRGASDEQSPAVQVVFQNNKFAKKYRGRIEQFIISLVQHAEKRDLTKPATDLTANQRAFSSCIDLNDKLPVEKRTKAMQNAHGIIGSAQFHNGFMVDYRGWLVDEDKPADDSYGDVPKYFQVFDEVFPTDVTAISSKPVKSKNQCFNCGGEHRLSECKTPKDQERIRAKRREHMDKKSNSNPGRYHEDPELNPKQKTKFNAGTISDGLREAMGLKTDQLPSYIYRMRLFGYPPGWLMEANRKSATLAMYDRNGRETNIRGESLEDGEYAVSDPAAPFDLNKIIEYPGFTVPVPLGVIDESERLGMPPIQQHQLKKTLLEDVVAKETAKKRRNEEKEADKNKKLKTDDKTGDDSAKTSAEEGEVKEDEEITDHEGVSKEANEPVDQDTSITTNGDDSSLAEPEPQKSPSEVLREKNFSFTSSGSISRDFGTPILIRQKSIQSLPDPGKFGQGIEDHIPFENLPDSTGKFNKLISLFSMIKDKVKNIKK